MGSEIRVGIVEDDPSGRALIVEHLNRYQSETGERFDVQTFADGRDLVSAYRPDLDLLFLDIQMAGLDGLSTARQVRTVDEQVVIVFVTSMANFALEGYEVDALSYLVKPVPYAVFVRELRRSIARVRRHDRHSLMISTEGSLLRLDVSDIVYIESIGHRIVVHTLEGAHDVTGTLKAFERQLHDKGFFRSNSCYLVNLRHVTGVNATGCVMRETGELRVSRPRRRAFLAALTDHLDGWRP